MCVILYDSYAILRIDDISLDFKINRCSIRLLENQTVTDATGRERLMTLKDYNIKENNVIAMVMKDHTTTNLNGYDENERIVSQFFTVWSFIPLTMILRFSSRAILPSISKLRKSSHKV